MISLKYGKAFKNTPNLSQYSQNGVTIPPYNGVDIIEASKASIITLQLLKGAALGTASAFLAVGAIQGASSVMKATSTMSSVSVAALNSALASMTGSTMLTAEGTGTTAALGTDSLAASSGLALGSVALGGATLGLGFLVGGISLCMSGSDLQDQADTAWEHMKKAEEQIDQICDYLIELRELSNRYYSTLEIVNDLYQKHLNDLKIVVDERKHICWTEFSPKEQLVAKNTVLLVGLLHQMCKVELVLASKDKQGFNTINKYDQRDQSGEIKKPGVIDTIKRAETFLEDNF